MGLRCGRALLRWPLPFKRLDFLRHVGSRDAECSADGFDTDSVLFLFVSMFVIAGVLYLPEHLSFIASRAFYYYVGEEKYREQYHQADALRTGAVPPQGVNPEL